MAPSARKRAGKGVPQSKRGSGGDESFSGVSPVLSCSSGVAVSVQVILKSSLPKLQRVASLLESIRAKATRIVKGTDSQKQFNSAFTELASVLSSVVGDVDIELEEASLDPRNQRAFASGGAQPGRRPYIRITAHTLLKDVARYITSQKDVTIGASYLESLAVAALKGATQDETAASAKVVGVKPPKSLPSPILIGAASPLQETDGSKSAKGRVSLQKKPQSLLDNPLLGNILRPWETLYPFPSGHQPERVMSSKPSFFRQEQEDTVIALFKEHHPRLYNEVRSSADVKDKDQRGRGNRRSLLLRLLFNSKAERRFSEERLYQMAPKVLDVCCGPSALDMTRKWDQREALFAVLLDPETHIFKTVDAESIAVDTAPRRDQQPPAVVVPLSTRDPFAGSPTLRPRPSPLMSPATGPLVGELTGLPSLDIGIGGVLGVKREREPTSESDVAVVEHNVGQRFFPHRARPSLLKEALSKAAVVSAEVPDGRPVFTDEELLLASSPLQPSSLEKGGDVYAALSQVPKPVLQTQLDAGIQPPTTVSLQVMTRLVHFGVVTAELPLQQQ